MFILKHQTNHGTSVHEVEYVQSERRQNPRTGQPFDVLIAFGGTLRTADGTPAELFGGSVYVMNADGKTVATYHLGEPGEFGGSEDEPRLPLTGAVPHRVNVE